MRQRLPLLLIFLLWFPLAGLGQDEAKEPTMVKVIDFRRDIAPIFESRCLQCHGPKTAKNDFRIDDRQSLLGYIKPGDVQGSSLWTDYLRSDDPDMQMPPSTHDGPLSASELALVSVWINEGAEWPEGVAVSEGPPIEIIEVSKSPVPSILARVWTFQGYLHPATVHFPIALLLVGGLFVVVGWKYPLLGQNVALTCLFLGTISAIAATAMGWSFAVRQGYGSWDRLDTDSEIFWHRWSAMIVTFAAIITSLFAIASMRDNHSRLTQYWKVGLVVIAAMVGAVGHQGGELTYGKLFYQEALEALIGTEPPTGDTNTRDDNSPGAF